MHHITPVHVEEMLANSDFEPDAFTTDVESPKDRKYRTSEAGGRDRPLSVMKDINWNFADNTERPRPMVFTIDLQPSSPEIKSALR